MARTHLPQLYRCRLPSRLIPSSLVLRILEVQVDVVGAFQKRHRFTIGERVGWDAKIDYFALARRRRKYSLYGQELVPRNSLRIRERLWSRMRPTLYYDHRAGIGLKENKHLAAYFTSEEEGSDRRWSQRVQ
jgi:hypothetical protein